MTIWHSFGCHPLFGIIRDPPHLPSHQDSICHVRTSPHLLTHRRRGGMHNDARRFHAQIRAIRIWTYSTACQDDPNPYQIRTSRDTAFLLSFAFHLHTSTIDCFRNGYPNQLSPLLCHPLFVHPTIQGMASPDHDMNGCQPPGHHRTSVCPAAATPRSTCPCIPQGWHTPRSLRRSINSPPAFSPNPQEDRSSICGHPSSSWELMSTPST